MSSVIKLIQTSCACPCLPKALCSVLHFCCWSTQVSPPTFCTWRERWSLVFWCSFDITRYNFQGAHRAGPTSPGHIRKLPKCTHSRNLAHHHDFCKLKLPRQLQAYWGLPAVILHSVHAVWFPAQTLMLVQVMCYNCKRLGGAPAQGAAINAVGCTGDACAGLHA